MQKQDIFGLSAALITPFRADGSVDLARLVRHGKHVLEQGCDSITLFGTTGEGFSIGMRERTAMIGAVLAGGIEARKLNAGVTATTVADAVEQSRLALDFGANGLLLAPPYFFKGPDDDGLFRLVFRRHRGHRCGRTRRDPLPHSRTDCGSPVGRPCRPPEAGRSRT